MDYLSGLCDVLTRDPETRTSFRYRPNSSLYRAAGRLHYLEGRLKPKENERSFTIWSRWMKPRRWPTPLSGPRWVTSFAELAAALVEEDVTQDEAENYIAELIDNQVLVPEGALPITGASPTASFIERLLQSPATAPCGLALQAASDVLAVFDQNGLGNAPEKYRETAHRLESFAGKANLSCLYQVDMLKPAVAATLGTPVLREIMRGLEILQRIAAPRDEARDELKRFRNAFFARYEGREVSLTEALDSEAGPGFPRMYPRWRHIAAAARSALSRRSGKNRALGRARQIPAPETRRSARGRRR